MLAITTAITTDGGQSFHRLGNGFPFGRHVGIIAADQGNPPTIYVGANNGIYRLTR